MTSKVEDERSKGDFCESSLIQEQAMSEESSTVDTTLNIRIPELQNQIQGECLTDFRLNQYSDTDEVEVSQVYETTCLAENNIPDTCVESTENVTSSEVNTHPQEIDPIGESEFSNTGDHNSSGTNEHNIASTIEGVDTKNMQDMEKECLPFLFEILECPVCMNRMHAPISICESGHSICNSCRPFLCQCPICRRSFLQARNLLLEEIVSRVCFVSMCECQTHKKLEICNAKTPKYWEKHQTLGESMFGCPLTLFTHCYWFGPYNSLRQHLTEVHPERILPEISNSKWELSFKVRDLKIIFTCNEVFLYKENLDTINKKFYVQVFHIGSNMNFENFQYCIKVSSEITEKRIFVHHNTLSMDVLGQDVASNSAVIDYNTISNICKNHDLKYTLYIERNRF